MFYFVQLFCPFNSHVFINQTSSSLSHAFLLSPLHSSIAESFFFYFENLNGFDLCGPVVVWLFVKEGCWGGGCSLHESWKCIVYCQVLFCYFKELLELRILDIEALETWKKAIHLASSGSSSPLMSAELITVNLTGFFILVQQHQEQWALGGTFIA